MFYLVLWNRRYGNSAKFIVKDEAKNYSEYTPSKGLKSLNWTKENLLKKQEYSGWEDFGHEAVKRLETISM